MTGQDRAAEMRPDGVVAIKVAETDGKPGVSTIIAGVRAQIDKERSQAPMSEGFLLDRAARLAAEMALGLRPIEIEDESIQGD